MARKKLLLKRSAFRYCPEKYKIKRKITLFFSVNTWNISSHVLKISSISIVLRTRENVDIFNTFDEIYFSHLMTKPTKRHVRPEMIQISLDNRPVWSESPLALSEQLKTQAFFMRTAKTLIRLGGYPGWSESSLGVHAILVLSWGGSFGIRLKKVNILYFLFITNIAIKFTFGKNAHEYLGSSPSYSGCD